MKIIDVSKNFSKIVETEVPLSPESKLTWVGFSDEGQLFTYDSEGVLRAFSFSMGGNWVPMLDVRAKYDIEPDRFWVVGVSEGDVTCCVLKNKSSPDQRDKHNIKSFKLCVPLLGLDRTGNPDKKKNNVADSEEHYLRENMELTHQQWRRGQWSHLRNTRTQNDPSHALSSTIWTDIETTEKKKVMDKITINCIRISALSQDKMKVLSHAKRLNLVKSYTICISLLEELKQPLIAEELRKMRDNKETEELQQREKALSSVRKSQEKDSHNASINEKILKSRLESGADSIANMYKKQLIETKPQTNSEPVKVDPVVNPFLKKKENVNTDNKKKDLFANLLKMTTQKQPAPSTTTVAAKKKL